MNPYYFKKILNLKLNHWPPSGFQQYKCGHKKTKVLKFDGNIDTIKYAFS